MCSRGHTGYTHFQTYLTFMRRWQACKREQVDEFKPSMCSPPRITELRSLLLLLLPLLLAGKNNSISDTSASYRMLTTTDEYTEAPSMLVTNKMTHIFNAKQYAVLKHFYIKNLPFLSHFPEISKTCYDLATQWYHMTSEHDARSHGWFPEHLGKR